MTATVAAARNAYTRGGVATAAPPQLLVMLWDRIVLDVERALRAQLKADWEEAHHQLLHAQACYTELLSSLDTEGWEAGPQLASLYDYLNRRLVVANVQRDQRATKEVLAHSRALRDTWHQAVIAAAQQASLG